jgi:ABC-type transport system substrate-binding protein
LLRRGLSQDTRSLNPFTYSTPWEADIVSSIYDSMLKTNPMTGGPTAQFIDWGARFEGQVPGVHFGETYDSVTDVTTQNWQLRSYWNFQDNNPVTVDDVAYSILAYRAK